MTNTATGVYTKTLGCTPTLTRASRAGWWLLCSYDDASLTPIGNHYDGHNHYGCPGYPAVLGSYEWASAGYGTHRAGAPQRHKNLVCTYCADRMFIGKTIHKR